MKREKINYWIYIALFGAIWGGGTSILAGILPAEQIARVLVIIWFEVTVIVLLKLFLLQRYCVTHAMIIASLIAIFTYSFGPPSPYKPMFIFAGLAFDLGTGLRTTKLKLWNMLVGFLAFALVTYPIFTLNLYLLDPVSTPTLINLIYIEAGICIVLGIITSALLWTFLEPSDPPAFVMGIRRRIDSTVFEAERT